MILKLIIALMFNIQFPYAQLRTFNTVHDNEKVFQLSVDKGDNYQNISESEAKIWFFIILINKTKAEKQFYDFFTLKNN